MEVAVSEAKAQLTELVRRAEAGEEVILTRHGTPIVQLSPVRRRPSPDEVRRILNELSEAVRARNLPPGPCAARAADFLYDDDGLPA